MHYTHGAVGLDNTWESIPPSTRKIITAHVVEQWPDVVEIIRAALEQAWDEGWNDGREQWPDGEFVHALTDNPYAKGDES